VMSATSQFGKARAGVAVDLPPSADPSRSGFLIGATADLKLVSALFRAPSSTGKGFDTLEFKMEPSDARLLIEGLSMAIQLIEGPRSESAH
jgi:hypothetical protein